MENKNENQKEKWDVKDKIIAVLMAIIIILIIAILVVVIIKGINIKDENDTGGKLEVENNNVSTEIKTEFDISVEEQYENILEQYFGMEALNLYDYDNLARYPGAYKDTMIEVTAVVEKVLEEKDDNYKILVSMKSWLSDEDEYLVIEGKYGKSRYLTNDYIKIYGVYKGNDTYNVDGKNEVLPKINVVKIVVANAIGEYDEYDEDDIREIAEAFFETPFTLTKPNYDYTDKVGLELMQLPFHYIITLDNNSNARFNDYRVYTSYGRIDVATEDESLDLKRYIDKSSDNEHFILSNYTKSNDYLEIQLYDKDFKQIWSRKFEDAGEYIYDINNGRIVLAIDNELYLIDETTGKDIISPIIISKASCIKLLSNGDTILVTESFKDFIIYVTKDGSIKWKTSLSTYDGEFTNEVDGVYSLLIANEKIYVGYYMNNFNDSHAVVFDENGNELVNTFASPN